MADPVTQMQIDLGASLWSELPDVDLAKIQAEAMEARFGADHRIVAEYEQHKDDADAREHERRVEYMKRTERIAVATVCNCGQCRSKR